jgi:hypothetical protein
MPLTLYNYRRLYDLLTAIQMHGGGAARAAVFFAAFAFFMAQLCVNVRIQHIPVPCYEYYIDCCVIVWLNRSSHAELLAVWTLPHLPQSEYTREPVYNLVAETS